jgi:hypothetical protein
MVNILGRGYQNKAVDRFVRTRLTSLCHLPHDGDVGGQSDDDEGEEGGATGQPHLLTDADAAGQFSSKTCSSNR